MTDLIPPNEDERDLLAAEYVLGLLLPSERQAVEQAIPNDDDLRRRIGQWSDRFYPLMASVSEVTPPAYLWTRLQAAIGTEANDNRAGPKLRRLLPWLAAAAALFAVILWSPFSPQPTQLATLTDPAGQSALRIAVSAAEGEIHLDPALPPLADSDYELWLIEPGAPPRSLGIAPRGDGASFAIPDFAQGALASPNVLAITVEPVGGSPSGLPTGPVIFTGPIVVTGTRG